jgi:hypothetical protein
VARLKPRFWKPFGRRLERHRCANWLRGRVNLGFDGCEVASGAVTAAEASQQGEKWPSRQPEAEAGTYDRAAHARTAFESKDTGCATPSSGRMANHRSATVFVASAR